MDKGTNKASGILLKAEIPNREGWVDARSLHQELGVKTPFSDWIKVRIKRFGFIQGLDYQVALKPSNNPRSKGGMLKEYALSPDMAEKLSAFEQYNVNFNANLITSFNFGGRRLRVIDRNGKLWFVVKDVVHLLGLSKRSSVIFNLDGDDRTIILLPADGLSMPKTCQIISEFGLLYAVFRSDTPQSAEISKWLLHEALPKIRKAYATPHSMLDKFHRFIKSFRKQPETVPAREAQNE